MTTTESIRELVRIVTVDRLDDIEGADFIQVATIDGWKVVVKKGEFSEGSLAVYFELDSALPTDDERFAFLVPRGVRIIDGKNYQVLKTARLRGVYSQGLLLPLGQFIRQIMASDEEHMADLLGVIKWERPVPAELGGKVEGGFPTQYAMKTDSETNTSP